jgi:hypothetical protein
MQRCIFFSIVADKDDSLHEMFYGSLHPRVGMVHRKVAAMHIIDPLLQIKDAT